MFNFLKDPVALERSMNKSVDRENDGLDSVRNFLDTTMEGIELGEKGMNVMNRGMNLLKDFSGAVGKSSGNSARTSSEAGFTIDASDNKRPRLSAGSNVSIKTPVGHSDLSNKAFGLGVASTQVVGNSWTPPVRMTLGKQVVPTDSIQNFLSLFNQTGSVSTSFGGRLQSGQDARARVYHCFRHMLRDDIALTSGAAYPTTADILNPSGGATLALTGFNTTNAVLADTPITDQVDSKVYFSPYNLADLEDVSFNLNKFKLGPQSTTSETAAPFGHVDQSDKDAVALLDDCPVLIADAHRCNSAIFQNNIREASFTSTTDYSSAPFKYDACLKQGTVDYLFMNKGDGPLTLEIVVYRVKKNGGQQVPIKWSHFNITSQLETPIGEGYVNKVYGVLGTDKIGTVKPAATDVVTDPSKPFLPNNRYINQSELAYKEVERVKLCINSGERRPFQLKLGGAKYDPAKEARVNTQNSSNPGYTPGIFTDQSYIVCLALNGVAMSRYIDGPTFRNSVQATTTTGSCLGDVYSTADLQWYAHYTEDVCAMSYKKTRTRNVYSGGAAPKMGDSLAAYNVGKDEEDKLTSTPVALLTQAQAVRLPQAEQQNNYGTNGVSGTTRSTTQTTHRGQATGGSSSTL